MKLSARASFVGIACLLLLLAAPSAVAAHVAAQQTGLKVHWTEAESTGLGRPLTLPASAHANGTFVISSVPDGFGGRIWTSSDGVHWSLAWSGNDAPSAIVAGGPGFVAWSSGILLSSNGRHWTQANAGVPQALMKSDFPQLGSVGGTVVAFPDSGHGFWSADGQTWSSINSGPRNPVTLASDGTSLWALTGGRGTGPVQVWVTTNGKDWTNTTHLPNSKRVNWLNAAFGPLGGVVIAGAKSWFSADGVHWHVATNTPTLTDKGRDFVDAVIADVSGFVVAAHRDPPGCAIDPAQRLALTFTSTTGDVWRKMSSKGFLGHEIDHLFISGRTLIGVGINWLHDPSSGTVWTAPLPEIASDTAPPPAPVPPPGREGC